MIRAIKCFLTGQLFSIKQVEYLSCLLLKSRQENKNTPE